MTETTNTSIPKFSYDAVTQVNVKTFEYTYTWKIENYNCLEKRQDYCLDSPDFSFEPLNSSWCLIIYPNGCQDDRPSKLTLELHHSFQEGIFKKFKGSFSISLFNEKQYKLAEIKQANFTCGDSFQHWSFELDDIRDKTNESLPNSLIISCKIKIILDPIITNYVGNKKQQIPLNPLEIKKSEASRFEKLFLDERLSDVKLIASCGKSLPTHKSILVANSPVFEAMFTQDMLEKRMKEVKIEDAEYEALKEMLRFMYSSKLENEPSSELVKLADKYEIFGLIEYCEDHLSKEISVNNVFEIFYIADRHNVKQLKTLATDFIKMHMKDVVKTDEFKSLTDVDFLKSVFEAISE